MYMNNYNTRQRENIHLENKGETEMRSDRIIEISLMEMEGLSKVLQGRRTLTDRNAEWQGGHVKQETVGHDTEGRMCTACSQSKQVTLR